MQERFSRSSANVTNEKSTLSQFNLSWAPVRQLLKKNGEVRAPCRTPFRIGNSLLPCLISVLRFLYMYLKQVITAVSVLFKRVSSKTCANIQESKAHATSSAHKTGKSPLSSISFTIFISRKRSYPLPKPRWYPNWRGGMEQFSSVSLIKKHSKSLKVVYEMVMEKMVIRTAQRSVFFALFKYGSYLSYTKLQRDYTTNKDDLKQ